MSIPVIDFSAYSLDKAKSEVTNDELKPLVEEIFRAFTDTGFCYLKNHGFKQQTITDTFDVSKQFYALDEETKLKYLKPDGEYHGYIGLGREAYNQDPSRIRELRESFVFHLPKAWAWPAEVNKFESTHREHYKQAGELAYRVLDTISLNFNKEERNFMRNYHTPLEKQDDIQCGNIMRTNWYPAVEQANCDETVWSSRFGEHTDYTTLALVFQDKVGGLEVRTRAGQWLSVDPIPGTIVVNIGDMMKRWTSDKMVSARHRVGLPTDKESRRKSRQSITFFCGQKLDEEISCLDGSNKYPPITPRQYYTDMLKVSWSLMNTT